MRKTNPLAKQRKKNKVMEPFCGGFVCLMKTGHRTLANRRTSALVDGFVAGPYCGKVRASVRSMQHHQKKAHEPRPVVLIIRTKAEDVLPV